MYCQKCGLKLSMTTDEAKLELIKRRKKEIEDNTEFFIRRLMMFAIVLFVMGMIVWFASGTAPTGYFMPSAAKNSKYVQIDDPTKIIVEKLWVPYETKFQ